MNWNCSQSTLFRRKWPRRNLAATTDRRRTLPTCATSTRSSSATVTNPSTVPMTSHSHANCFYQPITLSIIKMYFIFFQFIWILSRVTTMRFWTRMEKQRFTCLKVHLHLSSRSRFSESDISIFFSSFLAESECFERHVCGSHRNVVFHITDNLNNVRTGTNSKCGCAAMTSHS